MIRRDPTRYDEQTLSLRQSYFLEQNRVTGPLADVARLLHKFRLDRGCSREDLAREAGVAAEAIASYESDPELLTSEVALRVIDTWAPETGDQSLFGLAGRVGAGSGRAMEALPLLQEAREQLSADGRTREAAAVGMDMAALLIERGDQAGLTALARDLEALARRKKLATAVRSRLKVFCWSVRGNRADPERIRTLARELRRAIGRLRRPYQLPCSESKLPGIL